MNVKYIMLGKKGSMMHTPILFPEHLEHIDVANKFGGKENIVSAGFTSIGIGADGEMDASCWGESVSLGMSADSKKDAAFIKRMFIGY